MKNHSDQFDFIKDGAVARSKQNNLQKSTVAIRSNATQADSYSFIVDEAYPQASLNRQTKLLSKQQGTDPISNLKNYYRNYLPDELINKLLCDHYYRSEFISSTSSDHTSPESDGSLTPPQLRRNSFTRLRSRSNSFGNNSSTGDKSYRKKDDSLLSNSSKCRQLPCKTFLSTGSCPYDDRCAFMHDPRLKNSIHHDHIVKYRKIKEDCSIDAFFWMPMSVERVNSIRDSSDLPSVHQRYEVSTPYEQVHNIDRSCAVRELRTAIAVYSMWKYFVEFMEQTNHSDDNQWVQVKCRSSTTDSSSSKNKYTNQNRLPIFIRLACGQQVL